MGGAALWEGLPLAPLSPPSDPIGRGSSARAEHAAPRRAALGWRRRRSQWERPAGQGRGLWVSGRGRVGKQIRSACGGPALRRARGGCAKVTADPSFLQPGKAAARRPPRALGAVSLRAERGLTPAWALLASSGDSVASP